MNPVQYQCSSLRDEHMFSCFFPASSFLLVTFLIAEKDRTDVEYLGIFYMTCFGSPWLLFMQVGQQDNTFRAHLRRCNDWRMLFSGFVIWCKGTCIGIGWIRGRTRTAGTGIVGLVWVVRGSLLPCSLPCICTCSSSSLFVTFNPVPKHARTNRERTRI
jgi:hypothetical protein